MNNKTLTPTNEAVALGTILTDRVAREATELLNKREKEANDYADRFMKDLPEICRTSPWGDAIPFIYTENKRFNEVDLLKIAAIQKRLGILIENELDSVKMEENCYLVGMNLNKFYRLLFGDKS